MASWIREGLREDDLPQTLRDARLVTKALGCQRLWGDSLCIVQSPKAHGDWEQHSRIMDMVYGNSMCNIMALASTPSSGLFFPRNPQEIAPVEIRMTDQPQDVMLDLTPADFLHHAKASSSAPLLQRGWVFQEQLFSMRALKFSRLQMFWESSGTEACESFPKQYPVSGDRWSGVCEMIRRHINPNTNGSEEVSVYDMIPPVLQHRPLGGFIWIWSGILTRYTDLDLTMEGDRPVAIASLTNALERRLWPDRRSLAGVWDDSPSKTDGRDTNSKVLFCTLAWMISRPWTRPASCRAPSWSWAAVNGSILFDPLTDFTDSVQYPIKLVSVCIGEEKPTPKSGKLDLWGRLVNLWDGTGWFEYVIHFDCEEIVEDPDIARVGPQTRRGS